MHQPSDRAPWSRSGCVRLLALLLALCADGAAAAPAAAQVAEHQIKAAFLYKFVGYVEWPAAEPGRTDGAIVIGVAEADTLAEELAAVVAQRSVRDRPLQVRKLRGGDVPTGLHVLFIGADSRHAAALLALARGQPLLTVTESEQAFALGSMINFVVVEDKVRFDVALRPAERANLKVSARLLTVARKVIGDAP